MFLNDTDRARAIFELAITQPKLDMPELLWKAYIDTEIEEQEYDKTRALFQRLLERTQHVKVGPQCCICGTMFMEANVATKEKSYLVSCNESKKPCF